LKNEGINKMVYSAIVELPSFVDEGADKLKIAAELEIQNQPQVNVSIISGVDIHVDGENKQGNGQSAHDEKNSKKLKVQNANKGEKRKCC
jgi:hypothetical protein